MPRSPKEYAATHREAARFEPRLARAVLRAAEKLRDRVSINELAMALAAKDVKRAMAIVEAGSSIEAALGPLEGIVRDVVLKGGRVGAAQVNQALA